MTLSFEHYFVQLSLMLQQYREFWQVSPFRCDQLPWQNSVLLQRLAEIDDITLQQVDRCEILQRQYFADVFPLLFALPEQINKTATEDVAPLPFWLEVGIGGRKLQQIDALCQFWPETTLPVLEWCAGKGHLGRILAHRYAVPVTSVEWQAGLCEAGAALAEKFNLSQRFICADVLTDSTKTPLQASQHVVALHACGQLHISLLQQAVAAGCQQLQLVPCCYHLIPTETYQPLSAEAKQQDLSLSKDDLKLIVQGQVTGGERIEKLRATEVLWRLAYDEIRRDLTGDTAYRPLSSVSKQCFSQDFVTFARWAAAQHQLTLPAALVEEDYLQRAKARLQVVQRIELVRHLFRRPLEMWLALDKVLYLQQHGYKVELTTFCDYQITPRNLLLQASRSN